MNTSSISKEINLIKARHPLIDSSKVVPIDISLGKNYNSLIITGPNAGGKTVVLKTIGILTLATESGFHIAAEEGTEVSIFDNIFVLSSCFKKSIFLIFFLLLAIY